MLKDSTCWDCWAFTWFSQLTLSFCYVIGAKANQLLTIDVPHQLISQLNYQWVDKNDLIPIHRNEVVSQIERQRFLLLWISKEQWETLPSFKQQILFFLKRNRCNAKQDISYNMGIYWLIFEFVSLVSWKMLHNRSEFQSNEKVELLCSLIFWGLANSCWTLSWVTRASIDWVQSCHPSLHEVNRLTV